MNPSTFANIVNPPILAQCQVCQHLVSGRSHQAVLEASEDHDRAMHSAATARLIAALLAAGAPS